MALIEKLNAIGDAIRFRTGKTDKFTLEAMAAEIKAIPGGHGTEQYFEAQYAEVELPNATAIKSYAFYSDITLKNIIMPKVTRIEKNAFQYCTYLALTELPAGITSIGTDAFYGCTNLALTELPSEIIVLNNNTFRSCKNLALTKLPNSLTRLSNYVFDGCTNLALTELPSSITYIGNYAFQNCTNLKTITFKGKPSTIISNAFSGCTNLITINVPWAEGEVANAPWGATNATINYNYTGE